MDSDSLVPSTSLGDSTIRKGYLFPPFIIIIIFIVCVCSVVSNSLWPHGLQPVRLLCLSGSSVLGTFQARILEWVADSYSRGSSQPREGTHISGISCIVRWILHQ